MLGSLRSRERERESPVTWVACDVAPDVVLRLADWVGAQRAIASGSFAAPARDVTARLTLPKSFFE